MESAPAKTKTCSKCGANPASNGNPWCQPCRTSHAKESREVEAAMIGARNWQAGANALRQAMTEQLARAPGMLFQASAIARWMSDFPVPDFPTAVKPDTDNRA